MKPLATIVGVLSVSAAAFVAGRASTVAGPSVTAARDHSLRPAAMAQPEPDSAEAPPLSPEMQAMADANQPGPQHEIIARMAGSWKTAMTGMMPDGSEMRTEGTMHSESMFDGRFVGQQFSGEFMGMPFEGFGVYGFCTMTKQFQYCWFDSFGTHLYYATGEASADGKTLTYRGQEPDPTGGPMVDYRDEITFASDDEYTMRRIYMPDSGEFEGFSITFTRE